MANYKAAIRGHKKSLVRRTRNRSVRSKVRNLRREVVDGIREKKTKEELVQLFRAFESSIDSAVRRNVYHKNTASRYKSRLHSAVKLVNQP